MYFFYVKLRLSLWKLSLDPLSSAIYGLPTCPEISLHLQKLFSDQTSVSLQQNPHALL